MKAWEENKHVQTFLEKLTDRVNVEKTQV